MRGEDKVHSRGARGEHLLPFRNFPVRRGPTDHGDNQRGVRETPVLELDLFRFGVRIFGAERGCDGGTSRTA